MRILLIAVFFLSIVPIYAQWLDISNIETTKLLTELGGPAIEIRSEINSSVISDEMPGYIFARCSFDGGKSWKLIDESMTQGDGLGIVTTPGSKKNLWWGSAEQGLNDPNIMVRGIQMARIPSGEFLMKSFPGGGKDPSITKRPKTDLSEFYMAINETTIGMYVDYLNEIDEHAAGWSEKMKNARRCGIVKKETFDGLHFDVVDGRELIPISYVSWYDAYTFLAWCGLSLPTEVMFEKAFVGGNYLDGDDSKGVRNELPDRKFPWGNELPDQDNIYRCNFDGEADGYSVLAPVGMFKKYASPYGINDLAGNVAEWTLDWYTTTYHVGLDGFRMVRGGSWLAMAVECDAISGATQFPIKESSLMGFRGVKVK